MRELDRITQALAAAASRGEPAMLVTVLGVDGSVYRGAGARMVVLERGETIGAVSGGCLEADIVARSPDVLSAGKPEMVHYDTRASDDVVLGLGLGCQGVIDLLLEPLVGDALTDAVMFYRRLASHREPVELLTIADPSGPLPLGARLVRSLSGDVIEGNGDIAMHSAVAAREVVRPAISLVVCGGGADAIPLVQLARNMGWHVTVVDHRASFATSARFPDANAVVHATVADNPDSLSKSVTLDTRTMAVVMAHSATHDRAYLHLMLDVGACYIGMLGPRRRTVELLGDRNNGMLPPNVHSPVGLDIGAETPDEIALAIVSEIAAVSNARDGGMLRSRSGPIHDRESHSLHR